jgi:hypothetical protein
MASPSAAEAALKLEIARLTGASLLSYTGIGLVNTLFSEKGAINQAKSEPNLKTTSRRPNGSNYTGYTSAHTRSNTYVNPNYRPEKPSSILPKRPSVTAPVTTNKKDIVIGGVAFQSTGRSLVRKDCKFQLLFLKLR